MNARELHDDLKHHGLWMFAKRHQIYEIGGQPTDATILRALDLLARTEESTDEIVRRLVYMGKQYSAGQMMRGGSTEPHYLTQAADLIVALKARVEKAEALAESYRNPSDDAISASFAGLIETQDVPGQIKRRAEFKRRYLLVIAAIDAARAGEAK